jgi:transcriptional regulator with XRE-family HTH domain
MAIETHAFVRAVRHIRGLPQAQVVRLANISRSRYQSFEQGHEDLTPAEFEAVARVLRLDDPELFTRAYWEPDQIEGDDESSSQQAAGKIVSITRPATAASAA